MYSVPNGLLAPLGFLPPKNLTLGLSVAEKYMEPTEEPVLQKLDLDKASPVAMVHPPVVLSPKDSAIGKPKSPFSSVTMTRPPIVLPPKDPTIGLDLVEKCEKPKEELKMLFLPQKIDIDKINEYYRNEDLKIMNKNKPKEKLQQNPLCPPNANKGCRKALFKPSRSSIRKSFRGNRTSILGRKSTKSVKTVNESLLDSSLVERKIFNSKSQGTFKFKSPRAVQKSTTSRLPSKPTVASQKKKQTPKNLDKKPAPTTSTKRTNASSAEESESVANYLKEIKNLLVIDKESLDNLSKELEAFKRAHEDRFARIEDLFQKIERVSRGNSEPTIAKNDENHTPKRSATRVDTLRVSTLKKKVQFDANAKALSLYNSINKDCYMALSTPKVTRVGIAAESPAPRDPKKFISRKIQQQCLMLQTPMKK